MRYIKEYNDYKDQDLFDSLYGDIKDIISDINIELKDDGLKGYFYIETSPSTYRSMCFEWNEDIIYIKKYSLDESEVNKRIDRMVRFLSKKYNIELSYCKFFNNEVLISKSKIIDRIKFIYDFERKNEGGFYLADYIGSENSYMVLSEEIYNSYQFYSSTIGICGFRILLSPEHEIPEDSYIYDFKRLNDLDSDEIEYSVDVYRINIYKLGLRSRKSDILSSPLIGKIIDSYKFTCNIYDKEYENFYKLFIDNVVKNSGRSRINLIFKIVNDLEDNTFFEIDDFDYDKREITMYIDDRKVKVLVDNDLNVYLDGVKINSDDVVEEIYLKLTDKNLLKKEKMDFNESYKSI